MPELKKLYGSHKSQGLVLIGVHCDKDVSNRNKAIKANGLTFPVCQEIGESTQRAYGISGYPTVVVIDRKGSIIAVDPENLEATVKKALAKK